MQKTPVHLLAALAMLVLPAHAQGFADLYPTDRCVAEKLDAAGRHCRLVLTGAALGGGRLAALFEAFSRSHLAHSWDAADARSLADGVDCAETTVTSDEIADQIAANAEEIAADARGRRSGRFSFLRRWRASRDLLAAGQLCAGLLDAESRHLRMRDTDRERERLERNRRRALRRYASAQRGGGWFAWLFGRPHRGGGAHAEPVQALVADAVHATTVSPNVSAEWMQVTPDAEVPYHAEYVSQNFAPICSRGTPWVFFVKRGKVNKLFVHYQGGGACWDYATCETFRPFDQEVDPEDENPANFGVGLYDFENPDNPVRDWHHVFVPYCTGDVHWGGARYRHVDFGGTQSVEIEHKGWHNARVAEKWFREHFVHPDQVLVTGSSAGAYGAIVNSLPMQEFVYPSADFVVLGDAGNGVVTQDFLELEISKWGVEANLPPWIPALNVPLAELTAADLWVSSAEFYPQNRFATYTTAFDGSRGGQTGFYWIMLNPTRDNPFNIFNWLEWWKASCDWNSEMRRLNAEAASRTSNYRFYVGAGSRHTIEFNDKLYTDTTNGVPAFVDWLRAMIDDTPDWVNVECEDCGELLEGDPRPDPPQTPFTADDRIVCE